ncbi:MAG: hypothetical protein KF764_06575 [Labilithrix sp.]|nr:hypothetical protein [Labilithrix sp.]
MAIQYSARRGSLADVWERPIVALEVVAWAKAFAFTELVEAPIYRRFVPASWRLALAASAITHPFVWFAFPRLGERFELGWTTTSILSEVFAVAVEAAFFQRLAAVSWRRAALVSLLANGASVGLGLFVRRAFGIV